MKLFVAPFASCERGPPPKPAPNCMHETMVRLYNSDFRCPACFRHASMGWLYRCTVDKELVLDDELEKDSANKLDALCDIFALPEQPRPRSPGARQSILSFLEEMTDEQVEEYSQEQLDILANQRSHLLDVLKEADAKASPPAYFSPSSPRLSMDRSSSPSPSKPTKKPWLPIPAECDFKICHTCRPTSIERSWLSIDAIINDDAPATAIVGFGFNLTRHRPVGLVEHVKNLGLRTPPVSRRPKEKVYQSRQYTRYRNTDGMGLALFNSNSGSSRDSSLSSGYNPAPNPNPNPWITNPWEPLSTQRIEPHVTNSYMPMFPNPYGPPSPPPPSSSTTSPVFAPLSEIPWDPKTSPTPYLCSARNFTDLLARPAPLPDRFNPPLNYLASSSSIQDSCISAYAILTALPPQSPQERLDLEAGDTADFEHIRTECEGNGDGVFGTGPVAVNGGVAVTEEAIELSVADIMTQI